eukprot:GHVQ01008224.1.p1 GENE.GHVQ01008224.1~~GHVQ01008224.1.p1  ORF type:complete len:989 (-),score=92.65 GHVQ01008224.1:1769-4735(-)
MLVGLFKSKTKWVVKATSNKLQPPRSTNYEPILEDIWRSPQTAAWVIEKLQSRPFVSDPVVAFKTIILIQRIIFKGPPEVIRLFGMKSVLDKIVCKWDPEASSVFYQLIVEYGRVVYMGVATHQKWHMFFTGNWSLDKFFAQSSLDLEKAAQIDDPAESPANIILLKSLIKYTSPLVLVSIKFVKQSNSPNFPVYLSALVLLLEEAWTLLLVVTHIIGCLVLKCYPPCDLSAPNSSSDSMSLSATAFPQHDKLNCTAFVYRQLGGDITESQRQLAVDLLSLKTDYLLFVRYYVDLVRSTSDLRTLDLPVHAHPTMTVSVLSNLFEDLPTIARRSRGRSPASSGNCSRPRSTPPAAHAPQVQQCSRSNTGVVDRKTTQLTDILVDRESTKTRECLIHKQKRVEKAPGKEEERGADKPLQRSPSGSTQPVDPLSRPQSLGYVASSNIFSNSASLNPFSTCNLDSKDLPHEASTSHTVNPSSTPPSFAVTGSTVSPSVSPRPDPLPASYPPHTHPDIYRKPSIKTPRSTSCTPPSPVSPVMHNPNPPSPATLKVISPPHFPPTPRTPHIVRYDQPSVVNAYPAAASPALVSPAVMCRAVPSPAVTCPAVAPHTPAPRPVLSPAVASPPMKQVVRAYRPTARSPSRGDKLPPRASSQIVRRISGPAQYPQKAPPSNSGPHPGKAATEQQLPPSPYQRPPTRTRSKSSALLAELEVDLNDVGIERKVGAGATAQVYKGIWRGTDIALKKLNVSVDDSCCKEFFRELGIMIRLRHPNLVLLMGATTRCKPLCVVTEYCAGGTLFELLHQQKVQLSWQQKVKLAMDIAKGCTYLHACQPQIIHRDLKSLNILLSEPLTRSADIPLAKVSDFGLSKICRDFRLEHMTGMAGTYHWMAPEVLYNQAYNEKVDVYSYGIVLFEIVTGTIPYQSKHSPPITIALQVAQGMRPDLSCVPQDCPPKLSMLMQACWDQLAHRRPAFAQILEALRGIDQQQSL